VVFLALIGLLQLLPLTVIFEPSYLLPFLNTIFLAVMPFTVAYFAGQSYLTTGSVSVLLIGCALLVFGMGNLVAGWLMGVDGPNTTVTVHNITSLVASLLYIMAAFTLAEGAEDHSPGRRRARLLATYVGILVFVAFVTLGPVSRVAPVFFIPGEGATR
jgi:hypothetical protein